MNLPVDLAAASREELIEVVGQLLSYIGALEARIAELEGQAKPPTDGLKPGLKPGLKQGTPPAWVKANRPARAKKERRKRTHGFARRREEPTHKVEHVTASCPDCQAPLQGGMVRPAPAGDFPAAGAGKGDGACGAGTGLPQVPQEVGPKPGLERHHRGPSAVRHLGAERSERAP